MIVPSCDCQVCQRAVANPLSAKSGTVTYEAGQVFTALHERVDEQRRLIAALTADRDARTIELQQARLWLAEARDDINDLHGRLLNSRTHSLWDAWLSAAACAAVGFICDWMMWGRGL